MGFMILAFEVFIFLLDVSLLDMKPVCLPLVPLLLSGFFAFAKMIFLIMNCVVVVVGVGGSCYLIVSKYIY